MRSPGAGAAERVAGSLPWRCLRVLLCRDGRWPIAVRLWLLPLGFRVCGVIHSALVSLSALRYLAWRSCGCGSRCVQGFADSALVGWLQWVCGMSSCAMGSGVCGVCVVGWVNGWVGWWIGKSFILHYLTH